MTRPSSLTAQGSPAPFVVLIPARLASTRLPDKALADIGGLPMVVRVAQQAARSRAQRCVVATDHARIAQACGQHGVEVVLTDEGHASGSDRLAQACALLGLADDTVVVNVQGDEPLIEPDLINAVAHQLHERPDCVMATAAHCIDQREDFVNPNVVKVVTDIRQTALYFSRAPIPCWRDGPTLSELSSPLANPAPLRHVGIYAYRCGFLKRFPELTQSPLEKTESLEQLRVLWHGEKIAVHVASGMPAAGVDTPEDLSRVRALFPTAAGD